ncbi:sensor histidine kinase [Streptomyces poriferorum]|uniref:histidine kinase n=1 Tax=Streptomyces poriferorum TaxID=2798799 RepID=A0ABY9IKK9_9ACTN|nr:MULTISPECIES: nitrate- and nitrite sensing domain-containing protein [unclassified Streptomyces]MDP5315924.1 nitrate- and nitrite sensing domain-containing protein [Streptomyces sp. Alt4]WLQ54271.1 nitrate- and nitrite sensing domain-containing protein [Streptomyces sp. Alt2]
MRPPRTTPDPGASDARPSTTPTPAPRGRRAHAGPPADESAEHDSPPAEYGTAVPRGRRALRPGTVRAKIISLLMLPVVSLLALWGFATVSTAQDVARLRQLQRVDEEVRAPVASAVSALQSERKAAMLQSADPGTAHAAALKEQAGRTDTALDALRLGDGHTVADTGNLPGGLAGRLDRFLGLAQDLRTDKANSESADGGEYAVYDRYTSAVSAAFAVSGALTGIQDDALGSDARVLLELARADEMLAREDALLATAARVGTLEDRPLRLFTGAVDTRRSLTETAGADLPATERTAWRKFTALPAYRSIRTAEDKVLTAAPGRDAARAVPAADWQRAAADVRGELRSITAGAGDRAADRADPLTQGLLSPSGAAVIFGCVAVAASLVISVRIGRGLVVELVNLRNSALEIARRKLPLAMRRLRAGEELDIRAEAPPGLASQDEIGQVGEALGTVHRAALSAAVERAELADGISGVFVNLARRSQVLVHRQLNLLDSMERRADDPDELSDLFRLDHLTTRMRRHAESLIILSGAAPGRAWRMPVSLTNVVRAAVSEIEDYARVEVSRLPDAAVKGTAVADLTHLLAELVENAAQFSPPHTKVRITGEPVGNGYALEIEDRGLGMGAELLGEANRRIEQAEALDLFDSDRLGLFVVSRLAVRHRIKVQLRTSPYGGTTAVVLLPTALLQTALPPAEEQAAPQKASAERRDDHERTTFGPGPRAVRPQSTAFPAPVPVPALESRTGPTARVTSLRPRRPEADDETGPAPRTPAGDKGDDEALPRRVRQASLVPQLREEPRPEPPRTGGPAEDTAAHRTPEQARDRMTAYRAGWVRGGGAAPGSPVAAPGSTEPRPLSEGDPA